jgi:hypothetical protein
MRLEVRVDGGTFGPESKLLQGKEVVCFEEVFQAIGENFLKNVPRNVQEGYWAVWKGIRRVFTQLGDHDLGHDLVRKTLDNERVVFRERAEKMVGGLRRKFLTLLVTCMKKASSHLQ